MERLGIVVVLASIIYTVTSQTVEKSSGSAAVDVGQTDVKLQCRLGGFDPYSYNLVFEKIPVKGGTYNISSHLEILQDREHFRVGAKPENGLTVYTLNINAIKKSDDGKYRCNIMQGTSLKDSAEMELTVRLPISSLVLMVGSTEVNADEEPAKKSIELETFDNDLIIQCKVRGSNPAPQVTLSIGEEDITSQVLRQDQMDFKGQGSTAFRTYNTDLDSTGKKTFDESILGKEISCEGTTEGSAAETKKATILLTVKEPPKVNCNNVTSRLGDRRVKLTCVIESMQPLQKITWYVDNKDNEAPMFIQTNGVEIDGYTGTQEDLGNNRVQTTLEIYKLEEEHFNNIYTLRAEVPPQGIDHVVRLHQRKKHTTSKASGQPSVTSSGSFIVSEGDKGVQLKCTTENVDIFADTVRWDKVDNRHPGEKRQPLTSHISVIAENANKYSIKATRTSPTTSIYTLTIKEISKSDDAVYECSVVNGLDVLATSSEDLKVRQPIASVVLMVGSRVVMAANQPPKQTFELETFDEDLVIQCKVRGSNPEPRVKLSIGGEDITQQVHRQDQTNVKGERFNSVRTYDTDLDSTGKKTFDESILGKDITCEAYMQDKPDEKMTATAVITVMEPPKVNCENVSATLGAKKVRLTCTIESMEQPKKIIWYVEDDDPRRVSTDGTKSAEYSATQKELGENKIETTLEIEVLDVKHFESLFRLQVEVAPQNVDRAMRVHQIVETKTGQSTIGGVATVSMTTSFLYFVVMLGVVLGRFV